MGYPNVNILTFDPWAAFQPYESGGTATGSVVVTAGTAVVMRAPAAGKGGAVTITEVFHALPTGAGSLSLVNLGTSGTAVKGTVCPLRTAWTGAITEATPGDYVLEAGEYLGVVWNAGTIQCKPGVVQVTYVIGK